MKSGVGASEGTSKCSLLFEGGRRTVLARKGRRAQNREDFASKYPRIGADPGFDPEKTKQPAYPSCWLDSTWDCGHGKNSGWDPGARSWCVFLLETIELLLVLWQGQAEPTILGFSSETNPLLVFAPPDACRSFASPPSLWRVCESFILTRDK